MILLSRFTALLLMLACLVGCHSAEKGSHGSEPPFKVIGFFGGGEWRLQRMTHLIPGFLAFDQDGNLAEWDLRSLAREAHDAGVKVIISFDGEHWQENFLPMTRNEDGSRDRFIANILRFCLDNEIDGVDYDWEIGGGFSPEQQALYSDLVVETRDAFAPYGLTVSIDAYFRDELNARGIAAVDWLQLMAYTDLEEMAHLISYWESRGVPKEKIVIGMAAGWGENREGFDQDLARAKTLHGIEGGYAGVMIFRTDLDPEDDASILHAVDATLAESGLTR